MYNFFNYHFNLLLKYIIRNITIFNKIIVINVSFLLSDCWYYTRFLVLTTVLWLGKLYLNLNIT